MPRKTNKTRTSRYQNTPAAIAAELDAGHVISFEELERRRRESAADALAAGSGTEQITVRLTAATVESFRKLAKQRKTVGYQQLIRRALDEYVGLYLPQ